jgi:oligopeptide transport system substrate-binding protein
MRSACSAALLIACMLLAGCTPSTSASTNAPTKQLADDQTLHVAIPYDVSLDPRDIAIDLQYSIAQNLFGGLFRFDDQLREIPDLAAAMPEVSTDGLVYTIKLNTDARFWDGHPVTAQDVVFSWNRAVDDENSPFASIFQPVLGYQDVLDSVGPGKQPLPLRGLTAPDVHTVVIRLSAPAGYFTPTLALPVAWVLNQADVELYGKGWSDDPRGAVGTGPFQLTSRAPGRSTTLVPVEHWWRGATGWLRKVVVDVVPDLNAELRGYRDGRYDLIGLGGYGPRSNGAILGKILATDPSHKGEVHTFPYGRTDWIGFNIKSGPFAGAEGASGRRALSLAIDRTRLARAACDGGTLCFPATGGLIPKGLDGYLGDGSDPMSAFDLKVAKADLQEWDPEGTKRQKLTYAYIANPLFLRVAENLRDQWKANLGIKVQLLGYDTHTFLFDRLFGDYTMFRGSWSVDYNSPQDWYDIFVGDPNPTGSGYADPSFFALLSRADASSGDVADGEYRKLGRMLLDQAVIAPLIYYTRTAVVKGYVSGFGANAFYAYPLTEIKILQH